MNHSQRGYRARASARPFPTSGHRSLYGATKLASELFVQEYCAAYGLKAVINRCGVIAGPGQWGRADQGVYALWVAGHYFGLGLRYTGSADVASKCATSCTRTIYSPC